MEHGRSSSSRGSRNPDKDRESNTGSSVEHSSLGPEEQRALLEARVRQQAGVAELGRLALAQVDLETLFDEAVRMLVDTLDIEYAKVLELLPDGSELLLRSGLGWSEGLVGRATVGSGLDSQAGYTLRSDEPVIVEDLRNETRFSGPPLLIDHGVISGMSAIIRGRERPFGVLGVHTRSERRFTSDDVYFLRSVANVLAMSVERYRIDAELHQRHQEFRALSENAPDIITRLDREHRHLYVNHAIEQYTGIPATEFIGKTNRELGMDEDVVAKWEAAFGSVFETGQECWIEFSFNSPNGERWFQTRLAPELDQNGNVSSILGITRDVTQQRAAAERLRESEERFRSLSTSSPVGIVVADIHGRLSYVNPRCEEITGVPVSRVLGTRWITLIHQDDRAAFLEESQRAFDAGHEAESELRLRASEQHETWVLLRASPMYDDDNQISGYVATLQDITERKLVERRLWFLAEAGAVITQSLDVQRTARAITEFSVPDFADYCIVHVFDSDRNLTDVAISHQNPALDSDFPLKYRNHIPHYREPHPMARVLRTQLPELLTRVDEDDWERFASSPEHLEVIHTIAPRSIMILPMIARNQLLGAISFLYSESGRQYTDVDMELASDLADRAALAIDNALLYKEAQQAVRTREEFLSIASHELKTPLTSVKGYAQLLEMATAKQRPDRERIRSAAVRVKEQVERLETLINDLLDVSRIQQGQLDLRLTYVDLSSLSRSVVERFREGTDITARHIVEVNSSQPVVGVWDAERLDQVVTNLLSNALKYSPEGGRVAINVGRNGPDVLLSVSDEGIGIPRDEQDDLFEPFKRTKNGLAHVSGSGLGLFIVRQIVEQHGGTIKVESDPGRGSTFIVRLPIDSSALREATKDQHLPIQS